MPFRTLCLILSLIVLLFTGRTAFADLKPEEIALVAASGSRESQALARYYCKMRGVPVENICSVDLPLQEVLPREDWQESVRPAIREWLAANDPQQRLRCLVTLWDVPLKITAGNAPDDLVAYRKYLDAERDARLAGLAVIARELQRLADGEFDDGVGSGNAAPGEAGSQLTLERLKSDLESQLQAAQRAVGQRADGEKKTRDLQRLQQLATTAGGSRVLLEGINNEITRQGAAAPAELRAGFEQLRGRLLGYHEARALLEQQPASPDRDTVALALVERSTGILGSVEWLDAQLAVAKKQETGASFDSELSLVLWPSDYRLLRWQPNYLSARFDHSPLRQLRPTLMVARIDGPTLAIAKRLIDDAVAVERAGGLVGKVYIDARGLAHDERPANPPAPQIEGSYHDFDQSLLAMANAIREMSGHQVVLNDSPELFDAGDCPQAALYCGWYSLGNYVDAFDFVQGAVAVHLASAEATTLRNENAKNWCKKLLDDGVCATIGPVYEPYLVAFPRPDGFFTELLRGERTLVEVYYRTKPFNSWMMVLVGDPLYRPYTRPE